MSSNSVCLCLIADKQYCNNNPAEKVGDGYAVEPIEQTVDSVVQINCNDGSEPASGDEYINATCTPLKGGAGFWNLSSTCQRMSHLHFVSAFPPLYTSTSPHNSSGIAKGISIKLYNSEKAGQKQEKKLKNLCKSLHNVFTIESNF